MERRPPERSRQAPPSPDRLQVLRRLLRVRGDLVDHLVESLDRDPAGLQDLLSALRVLEDPRSQRADLTHRQVGDRLGGLLRLPLDRLAGGE